jgi:hypothetical protein
MARRLLIKFVSSLLWGYVVKNILLMASGLALVGTLGIAPASASALLSLNKPVTCSGYYDSGSEVFRVRTWTMARQAIPGRLTTGRFG